MIQEANRYDMGTSGSNDHRRILDVSRHDDETVMRVIDEYVREKYEQNECIELDVILSRFPGIESRKIPFDIAIEAVLRDMATAGMRVDVASGLLQSNYPALQEAIARSSMVSTLLSRIVDAGDALLRRDPPAEIGPLLDDGQRRRYELGKLSGEGAYARTYLATDHLLTDEHAVCSVAIKLFDVSGYDPDSVKYLLAEANRASAVRHSNVVQVRDRGTDQSGWAYIVMEYVSAGTLIDWRPQSERQLLDVAIRLAEGLQAIHTCGLIHADIKPQNVLLAETDTSQPVPKLTDFGVSQVLADDQRNDAGTSVAGAYGNIAFQSPEVYRDGAGQSVLSDVYALAAMLNYLVTGQLPHPERENHSSREIGGARRLPISVRLQRVLDKATAADPAHRTRSAAEFAAHLRAVRESTAIDGIDTAFERTRLWGKRHPFAALSLSLIATAGPVLLAGASKAREGWAYERGKREVAAQALSIHDRVQPSLSARDTVYDILDAFMARELIRNEDALAWMIDESRDTASRILELTRSLGASAESPLDAMLIREQLILHYLQSRDSSPELGEIIEAQRASLLAAGLYHQAESEQLSLFESIAAVKQAVLFKGRLQQDQLSELRSHLVVLEAYLQRYLDENEDLSDEAKRDPRIRLALRAAEWLTSEKLLADHEAHARYKSIYLGGER